MSSTQRPRSAPSGDRSANAERQNVQSNWSQSPAPSSNAGEATAQMPYASTSLNSPVITGHLRQRSSHTATAHSAGGLDEVNPWIKKTLLTLDGGGVRGYSSLLILRALMVEVASLERIISHASNSVHPLQPRLRKTVRIQRSRANTLRKAPSLEQTQSATNGSSDFLPAHYFDYIAGTSTGGLIAIMLGRLHMNVDECLEAYEILADEVFGHPRRFHIRRPPWIPRDKYDHRRLEKVIKKIVKERSPTEHNSTEFRQPCEDMCRTIVIAWQKRDNTGTRIPHLFRSYHHPGPTSNVLERNPGSSDNYRIWEVGRATSAAPTYFEAIRLEEDDEMSEYIDGGFGANNPTEEAHHSVRQLHHNQQIMQVLVSIGTGKNLEADRSPSSGYGLYWAYLNLAAKWAAQSEGTHHTILRNLEDGMHYFRLNVDHGIGKMKLDAWKGKNGCKTLDLIRTKTQEYLDSEDVKQQISDSAKQLVEVRKARSDTAYRDRWERFCHGVDYACNQPTCPDGKDKRYPHRNSFKSHVELIHPSECDDLESFLDVCRQYPRETTPEKTAP